MSREGNRRLRIRFFNLGGGPIVVGDLLGFTEGGLVHAVRSLAPLCEAYDVTVVCPNVFDAWGTAKQASIDGVRIICPEPVLPARWMRSGEMSAAEHPLRTLLNWPSIVASYVSQSRQLARSDVDVVMANGIVASYLAGLPKGPWLRIFVIHHLYHDSWSTGASSAPTSLLARLERLLLRHLNADAIAVVNPSVASCLVKAGCPEDKVALVGNGVDTEALAFSAHHDTDSMVFIGRLRAAKGVESVIDAFAIVLKQRPLAVLHIVGDGILRKELHSHAVSLGLAGNVVFHGFVDEATKIRLLQSASVYLSASRFEGFGLPVVEAMAVGAVPVVSDIPAHRYVMQGRDAGFLTSSAAEMGARALELLQDSALREAMAAVGRQLVENMWTWNAVAARYRRLIDGVLSARRDR